MRSLKIQSKNTQPDSLKKNQSFSKTNQNNQLFSKNQASLRTKCQALLLEVVQIFSTKLSITLNISQKIEKWIKQNKSQQDYQTLLNFKTYLIEAINQFLQNLKLSNQSSPQKIIRIKSQDRIKLRLLKQNQSLMQQLIDTDQQKLQSGHENIIKQLRQSNKKLQRKLILVSTEFNQIKKHYEAKIQKLKYIINSTLSDIHAQMEAEEEYYERGNARVRAENMWRDEGRTNYTSEKYNLNKIKQAKYQGTQIQSNKFVTIPSIPILTSNKRLSEPKRQFSHRFFANTKNMQ